MATKSYGNCSKNYINCRKHPARTGTATKRVNDDFRAHRAAVAKNLAELKTKVADSAGETGLSKTARAKLVKELAAAEVSTLAAVTESTYSTWHENTKQEVLAAATNKTPNRDLEKTLRLVSEERDTIISEIKQNVDKEMTLQKAAETPLEGFKLAVTNVLVRDGQAYQQDDSYWGDTRGRVDYEATSHLNDGEGGGCKPAMIRNYAENFSWSVYDSFSSEQEHGIAADISCSCGTVFNKRFIIENEGFGSILERIMNS
jgi:predicted transcriptional regulator